MIVRLGATARIATVEVEAVAADRAMAVAATPAGEAAIVAEAVPATATRTASPVKRRVMTRGVARVTTPGAHTATAAVMVVTRDVAVMATVDRVPRTVTPTAAVVPPGAAPARTKLTLTGAVASSAHARS